MDREEIREKIKEAKDLVGDDEQDPFIRIAFKEVFRMLLNQSVVPQVKGRSPTVVQGIQRMQISEFLVQLNVKSETDRVDAILYHYLHNDETSSTREEILRAYATARLPRPTNLSDVIARCIRKGHIIESPQTKDGQKAWQITPTGEKYVEEELVHKFKREF